MTPAQRPLSATSWFPDMKRLTLGCPLQTGRFDATLTKMLQAPGGPSRPDPPVLAGVRGAEEKPEIIEIRDCVCIGHMHADPALLIKAPCKVTAPHVRCPVLPLVVFVPVACPVTMNEIHDTAGLPLDRLAIDLVAHLIPTSQPSAAASNEAVPISLRLDVCEAWSWWP